MTSTMFSLAGKVAVVAGGGRGWLAALASYLAEAGADVAVCAPDKKQMDEAVRAVQKHGRRALAIPTDITDSCAVEDMVGRVLAEWGKIDILVNNADLLFAKPLFEVTDDEWQRVLAGNLTSVFFCCRAVGKQMMARGGGKIINISSVLAERGLPNSAAYCASKGGVAQLTRALALEWAKFGIQVNAINWAYNVPFVGLEALDDILSEGQVSAAVLLDAVTVIDINQFAELEVAGQ